MKQNVSLNKFLSQLGLQETAFFKDKEGGYSSVLHFDIQNKLKLINPDAVYIFNNQPLILFFDLTNITDSKREEDIHKKVWSFDNSPIAFVIKNDEIKAYNALNYIKKEKRLEEIDLSNEEIIEKFSFWNLQSNNVWKWFQDEYIETARRKETKKRVNERLFQNIKDVRNALIDKVNDPEGSIPNSLILRLIFIRYLIDRNIEIGSEFINGEDTHSRRQSFSKLLQSPDKLSQLFAKLNDRFNGVLFKDVDIKPTPAQAEDLSDVFKGEAPKRESLFYGSDFYFEIFDFSIIAVEVISGIYESLIDPETRNLQSAVYTPSFLVEYILNDTVDVFLHKNNTSECKIFEVAVGSGIFLVQSLRRMIEKEIELNGNLNREIFSERIRDIAKRNLYGIDINKEALKVTCFSIYIALLDYQEPKNIQNILWYMLECYSIILNEGKTNSLSDINKSNIKPENYLRNKLVDEYFREYTHLFEEKFKTEYIFFDKDTEETYIDKEGNESTDKIDIYIRNKALQDYWSNKTNVYYAVECKRIEILSDTQKYIDEDTLGKLIERKHIGFRLPYEGQLAFIQQKKNTPRKVADDINRRLSNNDKTKKYTIDFLDAIKVNEINDCLFISKHMRDNSKKKFVIYLYC